MRVATVRRLSRLHTLVYRLTSGLVGRRLVDNDMLLLTTTGRRTGEPRTVPLLHLTDGDRLVVIASWGGRDRHPAWFLNLQRTPEAWVQAGARRWKVRARVATGEERNRWWEAAVASYPGYRTYQERTEREIPVVVLEPAGNPPDSPG